MTKGLGKDEIHTYLHSVDLEMVVQCTKGKKFADVMEFLPDEEVGLVSLSLSFY